MSISFAATPQAKEGQQTRAYTDDVSAGAPPSRRTGYDRPYVNRDHWNKVFTQPEYFDSIAKQKGMVEGAKVSLHGDDYVYRQAMMGYLSATRNVPLDDMRSVFDAEKDGFAQKVLGKKTATARELFDWHKTKFERENEKSDAARTVIEDVIKTSLQDSLSGSETLFVESVAKSIEATGDLFTEEEKSRLWEKAEEQDKQIRATQAAIAPEARFLFSALGQTTGQQAGMGAPDMREVAGKFAQLPDNQRKAIYELAGSFAQLQKTDKGFWYQMAESLGRGTSDIVERVPRNFREQTLRGQLRLLESEQPVFRATGVAGAEFSAAGSTPVFGATQGQMVTPEEREQAKAKIQSDLGILKVERELRDLAERVVDPIKTVNFLPEIVEEGLYGAARSLPYTAAAAIPFAGIPAVAAALFSSNYDRIMLDYPDLDPDKAALIAAISAPIEAVLERMKVNTITGRLPVFGDLVKRLQHPNQRNITRIMIGAGGVLAEQNLQETVQGLTFPVVQTIAAAIDQDMREDLDVEKTSFEIMQRRFEDMPRELLVQFVALLPLSLMGIGALSYREISRGESYLRNKSNLEKAGYGEDQIDRIAGAATADEAQTILQEESGKRDPELVKAAAKRVLDEVLALREQKAPASLPRLEKQGADYVVLSPEGRELARSTDQTVAEQALVSARRETVQREMRDVHTGINEAVEFIQKVNEARQRGEDVAEVIREQSPRTLLTDYEANPTQENLDRLFETVRAFGQDINEPAELANFPVIGSNQGALAEGIWKSVIRINEGADGTIVMREFAQDNLKRAISEGRTTMDFVRQQLNDVLPQIDSARMERQLRTETDTDVIEAFSDIAVAYFRGSIREEQIPAGLRGIMRRLAIATRDIFRRAYNLARLRAEGKLDRDFEALLAEAVGVNQQALVDRARERTEQEVGAGQNYSIGDKGQKRAKAGGEVGPNGEWYEGGTWIARTDMPKKERERLARAATGREQVEVGYGSDKWAVPPAGQIPIVSRLLGKGVEANGNANEQMMEYMKFSEDRKSQMREAARRFAKGDRYLDVSEFPLLANYSDAARMLEDGLPMPFELLRLLPDVAAQRIVQEQYLTGLREPDAAGFNETKLPNGKVRFLAYHGSEQPLSQLDDRPIYVSSLADGAGYGDATRMIIEGRFLPVDEIEAFAAKNGIAMEDLFHEEASMEQDLQESLRLEGYDGAMYYDQRRDDGDVMPAAVIVNPNAIQVAPVANYSIVRSIDHFKNDTRFDKLVQDGRVVTGVDVNDFIDQHILLHSPDNAFAGTIQLTDGGEIKGKGGVYYPALYADKNYFWASTEAMVMRTANHLNEIGAKNGGRILMGLVSAPVEKLFSSTSMSTGVVKFLNALTTDSRAGLRKSDLNAMLVAASKVEVIVPTKTKTTKKTFSTKLKAGDSYATNLAKIDALLEPTGSIFQVRKAFVESLAEQVAKHLNATPASAEYVAGILADAENKHAKNTIKRGKLSKASVLQGLGNLLTEPFLRDFQEHGNGKLYAIVEVEGTVKGMPSTAHESYPATLVPDNPQSKVKLHVLNESVDWQDVVGKETGQYATPQERLNLLPTSGMSATTLKVLGVKAGSKANLQNYSIGSRAQPDVERNVITLPDVTISGPANYSIAAWHASPHKYDKVDLSKAGTGEGAAVYGWGFYMAENPAVSGDGGSYQLQFQQDFDTGRRPRITINGKAVNASNLAEFIDAVSDRTYNTLTEYFISQRTQDFVRYTDRVKRGDWEAAFKEGVTLNEPQIYRVEVDADQKEFLDWDQPFADQSEFVQNALRDVIGTKTINYTNEQSGLKTSVERVFVQGNEEEGATEGAGIYRGIARLYRQREPRGLEREVGASMMLKERGIKGIRYLDQGSRVSSKDMAKVAELRTEVAQLTETIARNEGKEWAERQMFTDWLASSSRDLEAMEKLIEVNKPTYNYVIFDDSLIKILTRNGEQISVEQAAQEVSNYSISTPSEIDRVQAAMGALDRSPLDTLEITEKLRKRFASIMAENMVELAAMRQGGVAEREVLDEEGNPIGPQPDAPRTKASGAEIRRTKLLQALGELDGLLSALPPQVAAKVGGYTVLANIGTGDRALSNFFIKRLEMIDKELERYLKDRYTKALDELFKRAKPKQDAAGKVPQGKLGASVHDLFDELRKATTKTVVEVDGEVTSLEQQVASGELEPDMEAMKGLLADVLPLFANWATADASRMAQAVQIGFDILRKAYKRQRELTQIKRNQQEERRLVAKESTGITGDIDEAINKQQNIAGKRWQQWKALNVNLFGFDQLISFVFGRDSKITKEIVNAQRRADNVKADELIGVWEEWQGVLAELAGVEDSRSMKATHKGQDIVYRLAEPKTAKIKHTNMQGEEIKLEFSQNQLITITMMWMQPKGRAHMMGKLDSDGNPIGNWHYDQDFVNRVEAKMTPEARAIRRFLLRKYAEEWSSINAVFVRLRGINMPQEDFYSPLGVDPLVAIDSGMLADPATGFALSAPNRTPPALRSRGAAVAKPKFQDAVQVYFAHRKQMAHWKAYAEFNSDMLSVLGHRNTRNAVEAKGGVEALKTLNKWLTYMTQGGNIDAAAGLAMNEYFNGVMGRIASFVLFGKVVTVAIQSTQLGAAAAKMPFPSYINRLAKLLTGQMSWGDSLRSPYIQRRIKEMPPQVQLAMEGLLANKPSYVAEAARRVGWYISGSDGLYTAGTYAMIYDYRLEQAKKAGLSGPEAERVAREEAERDTDEVAQPTRMGARSAFEATMTSPLARSAWAFGSDARKNWAMNSFLWFSNASADRKRQALYFTLVISTAMATVIRTIARDIKDDDDEEWFDEKNWDVRRMTLMMATDFVYGFPVLGEMAEETAFRLFGEYRPQGSVLSVGDSPAALSRMPQHIADTLNGEADPDKIVKDVNRMLQGMGLFSPRAASAAALSNAAKDLYEFTKPLWKDDE